MKIFKYASPLFIIIPCWLAFGSPSLDPLWLYKDLSVAERLYGTFLLFDTCRTMSIKQMYPVDTGDTHDSNYINFDYQFSGDSMYIIDPFGTDTIYKDYRPGYAGFKIDWDNGVTGFPIAKYKYLFLAHKGPLPNHKVTVRFGYNKECGTPTNFQTMGSFAASSTWKIDTIVIPDSVRDISQEEVNNRNYYELQFIINNADPADTNKSSAPGNFKVDNIGLAELNTGVITRIPMSGRNVSKRTFIPSANGSVQISAFSMSGELMYSAAVDVVGGKQYVVGSFIKAHVPLSPSLMQCIRIKGPGVDILQKVR